MPVLRVVIFRDAEPSCRGHSNRPLAPRCRHEMSAQTHSRCPTAPRDRQSSLARLNILLHERPERLPLADRAPARYVCERPLLMRADISLPTR
jgi:hypothetical protein